MTIGTIKKTSSLSYRQRLTLVLGAKQNQRPAQQWPQAGK